MSAGRRSECRPEQQGAEEYGGGCEWGEAAQTERWCVRAGQVCGDEGGDRALRGGEGADGEPDRGGVGGGTGREQGCRGGADREVVGERGGYADAELDSGGTSLARRRLSASVPTPRLASRRTFSLGERAL